MTESIRLHPQHEFLLSHLQEAVDNSWDGVILIDGIEGSGKSAIAIMSACYLDNTFSIERIVFTPSQFLEAVDNAKPGQAIVWDEFITGGMSNDFMSEVQKTLIKKMTMIRKKRLYILWVLPYFFIVGRYFAVARSRFLLHTYTPDGIKRGSWQAWNYERKKTMYFKGRKEFDYCVTPYTKGTFKDFFKNYPHLINEKEYEKKKDEASLLAEEETTTNLEKQRFKKLNKGLSLLIQKIRAENWLNPQQIADTCGYTRNWVYQMSNEKRMKDKSEDDENGITEE